MSQSRPVSPPTTPNGIIKQQALVKPWNICPLESITLISWSCTVLPPCRPTCETSTGFYGLGFFRFRVYRKLLWPETPQSSISHRFNFNDNPPSIWEKPTNIIFKVNPPPTKNKCPKHQAKLLSTLLSPTIFAPSVCYEHWDPH